MFLEFVFFLDKISAFFETPCQKMSASLPKMLSSQMTAPFVKIGLAVAHVAPALQPLNSPQPTIYTPELLI